MTRNGKSHITFSLAWLVLFVGNNVALSVWQAPIGIPDPPFGITTTHTMYADPNYTYDYGSGPVAYRIGPNGPYTHYIDPDDPNATDTSNPYGTHTTPRVAWPANFANLPAGSVLEFHGSGYGSTTLNGSGTLALPIFIRGVQGDEPVHNALGGFFVEGSYYVFENIKFDMMEGTNTRIYMGFYGNPTTHIAVRNCEFYNGLSVPTSSYQVIRARLKDGTANLVQNVVLYNNSFHDIGEGRNVAVKNDAVAVSIDTNVRHVWIVDNEFYRIGGDGIQVAWDSYTEGTDIPEYIYVGRNTAHDNYENFIDLKCTQNVIVSQNTVYDIGSDYSSYSGPTAIPFRYGTHGGPSDVGRNNIWTLFNIIYNSGTSDGAFYSASGAGETFADEIYYIGNLVYNSHNSDGQSTAFGSYSQQRVYWVNNVAHNCDRGGFFTGDVTGTTSTEKLTLVNNIFGDIASGSSQPYSLMIGGVQDSLDRMVVENNIFYNSAGNTQFRVGVWANPPDPAVWITYPTYSAFSTIYPGLCTDSVEADPLFFDIGSNNFSLLTGSPAIDSGTVSSVYQTFENLYGIDIRKDITSEVRPQGNAWDIGAYESTWTGPVLDAIEDKTLGEADTISFSVNATDPNSNPITYDASDLPTGATFVGQTFSWTPSYTQAGTYQVVFSATAGGQTHFRTVTITVNNAIPTTVTNVSPSVSAIQSNRNSLIVLDVTDTDTNVDASTVTIEVNGNTIYTGGTADYTSADGRCRRTGSSSTYTYIYHPDQKFDYDQDITVTVNASDLAATPHVMDEYEYTFTTEMRSFGEKKTLRSLTDGKQIISSGSNKDAERPLTAVTDSSGNVWVAWTEGDKDGDNNLINRDIFLGTLTSGTDSFESGAVIQATNDVPDQANPVLAIDSSDNLYLVWQDQRLGNWDLYMITSTNGSSWSSEIRITDPNYNQTNPAIAIDSSDVVYIVYDDDQGGDKDIYIASSSDNYATKTQISSETYDETTPDIAIDSSDTVYTVWADARNWNGSGPTQKTDIYGAASNNAWANIEVIDITEDGNQTATKIATEDSGTILHFVWVDDGPGDKEVYYASSDGLPGTPLTGTNIIDQGLAADIEQKQPALAVTGSGADAKVFACWEDERYSGIENIHAVETTNLGTNIWVGDDGAGADQKVPAIGIDQYNEPFLVWVNNKVDIIYSGSTFDDPTPLVSPTLVPTATTTTVGTAAASIVNVDDASVVIPAGAYLSDIEVTISRIRNPQKSPTNNRTYLYEFGPSGATFTEPVTITIPYLASSSVSSPSAYWYNPLTGSYSQTGISNVEVITISSGLYALRFKTTHFSGFGGGGPFSSGGGGGGGGGGCSMSPGGQGTILEFLLPYIGLAVVMTGLKLRDKRKNKVT